MKILKFSTFQKVLFLGVWCRKLSLKKIGVMDMSYIVENNSNRLYTTFPNIFHHYQPIQPIYHTSKKIIFLKRTKCVIFKTIIYRFLPIFFDFIDLYWFLSIFYYFYRVSSFSNDFCRCFLMFINFHRFSFKIIILYMEIEPG